MSDHARLSIAHWVTRVIAAGILVMGALPKLTGGAAELADRLPGGGSVVTAIAVVEILAIILMFVLALVAALSAGAATVIAGRRQTAS